MYFASYNQIVKEHCTHQSTKHYLVLLNLSFVLNFALFTLYCLLVLLTTLLPYLSPQLAFSLPGASRDRTDDPLLAKQMLSQLSYGPKYLSLLFLRLLTYPLGLGGLEPPTPRLSSVCSNQLSYRPYSSP